MGSYSVQARELPFDDGWDVIIVGGGPAGCTAAIAAAREGARTLLIEAQGALGGLGTLGLVPFWCPFDDRAGHIIYGGLAEKVLRRANDGHTGAPQQHTRSIPIAAEKLKRVYDDMVTESGATVLFNTMLVGVDADDAGKVRALILASKRGLTAAAAKVYVDCTGDADLAAWAGAEFVKGQEDTGELQPSTLCFTLTNVDSFAYEFLGSITKGDDPIMKRILTSGKYPIFKDAFAVNRLVGPGAVGFNAGHMWDVDNTDPTGVSAALMHGRKLAAAFRDALAEFFPEAFANAFLATTAPMLGTRESRRVIGDYVLTLEDYLARRSFPDEICRNVNYVDVHPSAADRDVYLASPETLAKLSHHYEPGQSHGIPYRCLTPKGLTNVLVAGKTISTDRKTHGSTRVMPVCLCMGEAAGLAAALAAEDDGDVHAVDTDKLRGRLREEGAYLPE